MTDASPFARLHRLAERSALHGTCVTSSDLIELERLLAYAEAAHTWASYHTDGPYVRLAGAYEAWVAFKEADRALAGGE